MPEEQALMGDDVLDLEMAQLDTKQDWVKFGMKAFSDLRLTKCKLRETQAANDVLTKKLMNKKSKNTRLKEQILTLKSKKTTLAPNFNAFQRKNHAEVYSCRQLRY